MLTGVQFVLTISSTCIVIEGMIAATNLDIVDIVYVAQNVDHISCVLIITSEIINNSKSN